MITFRGVEQQKCRQLAPGSDFLNDTPGIIGPGDNPIQDQIVWDLRVPRGLLAFVVAAGLAVAETVIQATVRNPLGDPYLLGIVPGASAGAVLVLVAGSASAAGLSLGGAAFAGAMIAFVATCALSRTSSACW